MAGSSLFRNLARGAKVIALLLFLLPWVTVSCSPQGFSDSLRRDMRGDTGVDASPPPGPSGISGGRGCVVLSATGLQLAIGSATPRSDCFAGLPTDGQEASTRNNDNPFDSPNIAVIVAAALLLLALLASFGLKGAAGAVVGAGGSLIAAGAIFYAVMIQAPALVRASFESAGTAGSGGRMQAEQLEQMIRTEPASGFWIVLVMLVLAVVLNLLAMKKPAAAPAAAPAPAATPPPPVDPPAGA